LKREDFTEFLELKKRFKPRIAVTYSGLFRCAVFALMQKIKKLNWKQFKNFAIITFIVFT